MFANVIESGRQLAARLARHVDINIVPPDQRMFSSEISAWFNAAASLVSNAFGQQSPEYQRWQQLHAMLAKRIDAQIDHGTWNEARTATINIGSCIGLLSEFQLLLDALPTEPFELSASLKHFRADHPDPAKNAFVMMQFGSTNAHKSILTGINDALIRFEITALRADLKQYHDDLFLNILTYIHGCGLGIAVFERIEGDNYNPNVALEVGYMLALGRPVCFLKDKTLKTLQTDLVGKLYRVFDPQKPEKTIPDALLSWLSDKGLLCNKNQPPKER